MQEIKQFFSNSINTIKRQRRERQKKGHCELFSAMASEDDACVQCELFSFFATACLCSITPGSEKDGVGKLGVCHKREGSLV